MDFTHDLSMANLLGFDKKIYVVAGIYESETHVNIISVNSILVNCDVVGGTYRNGKSIIPILYSLFPNVSP